MEEDSLLILSHSKRIACHHPRESEQKLQVVQDKGTGLLKQQGPDHPGILEVPKSYCCYKYIL